MATNPPTLLGQIITQSIAILVFVLVPIAITLMAPFTDLDIEKTSNNAATVKIQRYVLFFLPWQTKTIENVTKIRVDVTARDRYKDTAENRRKGNVGVKLATAQLTILSSEPEVIVQADPELAKSISSEFDQLLLSSENNIQKKYLVYASWGLSYILGGVMTFLCAFYIFGACMSILIYPFKILKTKKAL